MLGKIVVVPMMFTLVLLYALLLYLLKDAELLEAVDAAEANNASSGDERMKVEDA